MYKVDPTIKQQAGNLGKSDLILWGNAEVGKLGENIFEARRAGGIAGDSEIKRDGGMGVVKWLRRKRGRSNGEVNRGSKQGK
jgi:hypothetical protein